MIVTAFSSVNEHIFLQFYLSAIFLEKICQLLKKVPDHISKNFNSLGLVSFPLSSRRLEML